MTTGTHKRESTIRIDVACRDFDGELFDPDTHSHKIFDPSDTQKDEKTNPTRESKGKFYFYYTIPSDGTIGTWKVVAKAVGSSYTSIEDKTFEVVA